MLAIGDGHNDLSMLVSAGVGIAMANSPDEVNAKADWVTGDNDSDGVAAALRRFIQSGAGGYEVAMLERLKKDVCEANLKEVGLR